MDVTSRAEIDKMLRESISPSSLWLPPVVLVKVKDGVHASANMTKGKGQISSTGGSTRVGSTRTLTLAPKRRWASEDQLITFIRILLNHTRS